MTKFLNICSFAGLIASLATGSPAHSAETAKVMPKGIWRARVVGVQTGEITSRFNEHGESKSVSGPLNRTVTTKDFVAMNPKLAGLVGTLNQIEAGSGDKLLESQLQGSFSTRVQTVMPVLEYGVRDDLSIGIRVPIVKRSVTAGFAANSTNNSAALKAKYGALSPQLAGGLSQTEAMNLDARFFANRIFTSKGYDIPQSFEKNELGDIEFGAKYNFYKNGGFYATAQLGGRAPTGTTASLTNPYDQGSGNGAWATALQTFQEYEANRRVTFGSMQKVLYTFADTRARAVPRDENDSLPSVKPEDGQVEDVKRETGLELQGELSSTVYLWDKTWSTWGAYQVMNKLRDRYSGSKSLYYEGLAKNTEQLRQSGEVGVGYSTIPDFKNKKASVPMEIQALYNMPVGTNKNVTDASYARMDLIVYF